MFIFVLFLLLLFLADYKQFGGYLLVITQNFYIRETGKKSLEFADRDVFGVRKYNLGAAQSLTYILVGS